jgi:hypothetical protein
MEKEWFLFFICGLIGGIIVSSAIWYVYCYVKDGFYKIKVKQWFCQEYRRIEDKKIKEVYNKFIEDLDKIK